MQVSASSPPAAPSTAPVTAGAAGSLAVNPSDNATIAELKQFASIVADGSNASVEEKVNAYIDMVKTLISGMKSGALGKISKADADAFNNVYENSAVSKQIQKAGNDLNAKGLSLVSRMKTVNIAGVLNDAFNNMSPLDQLMTYAGTASPAQYTFEGFKAQLQKSADYGAAQLAEAPATRPAIKVTLSSAAKAALNTKPGEAAASETDDGARQALDMLTKPKASLSAANVALSMLQRASDKAKADEKASAEKKFALTHADPRATARALRAYVIGDEVDTKA